MAHPYHHAESSVIKWGGDVKDYVAIHSWFDESKAHMADFRHRALRHHTEGIFMCESIFGVTIVNSQGRKVPVRFIGEQHVKEDLGWIPTVKDWFKNIESESWMMKRGTNVAENVKKASKSNGAKVKAVDHAEAT
tara:strand:+ start:3000 stop:3404 length:405 start_codon:yes stop_codon:yes gene_type:complete